MVDVAAHTYLTFPGTLPFDDVDFSCIDELFTVPDGGIEISLSTRSSIDTPDVWEADLARACSSEEISSVPLYPCPSLAPQQEFEQVSTLQEAARPPPLNLTLSLDYESVCRAWSNTGSSSVHHPFQLQGPQLWAAASDILADPEASLAAAAASMPPPSLGGSTERPQAHTVAQGKGKSKPPPARKPLFGVRRSGDKRPRIKGRFVTRAEYEQMLAAAAEAGDHAVPDVSRRRRH